MSLFRFGPLGSIAYVMPLLAAVGCGGSPAKPAADPSSTDDSAASGGASSGPAEVGHRAPDLSLQTVNGKGKIGIGGFSGKVVVVDFWATWCGPCRKSFPALQEISKRHSGQVEIVGVSVNDEADGVADFAKELGTTFAIGWDEGHAIAERWKVTSMPSSFVLDAKGTVRFVHNGYHEGDADELEKEVSSLLGMPSDKTSAAAKAVTPPPEDKPAATIATNPPPAPATKPKPKKKKKKTH